MQICPDWPDVKQFKILSGLFTSVYRKLFETEGLIKEKVGETIGVVNTIKTKKEVKDYKIINN